MLPVAVFALALLTGDCPICDGAPPAVARRTILGVAIPRRIVGCVGQNCCSCSQPLMPGMSAFNYRVNFDYPWSQVPCALAPSRLLPVAEPVPTPNMETRRKVKIITPVRRASLPSAPIKLDPLPR